MRSESEVRARELLAAEYEAEGDILGAGCIRDGVSLGRPVDRAIRAITAALASQGEQHGALLIGDDGQPMVLVSQEFKSQADHDAETASAVANLLRNNSLGLSGSQPEMVAALLDLAARQPVGECGTCGEAIKSDVLTGTTCGCARIERSTESPKPVVTYCGRRLTPAGTRECWGYLSEAIDDLPRGTKLYTTPPAQPQAPAAAVPEDARSREVRAIGAAVERACEVLPEFWSIRIELECGSGIVYLTDPQDRQETIDSADTFSSQINEAIETAIAAAPAPGVE